MIKNTLLIAAIAALVANIYCTLTNPPGPIIHRRAEVAQPNSYRLQLEKQFHTRYGQELSRLYRHRPNTLKLHLAYAGASRALKAVQDKQGSIDPVTYDTTISKLLVLQAEAEHNLKIGKEIYAQVTQFIRQLQVFGTERFYNGDIDHATLDRTYRGALTLQELEEANADLEALIITFRVSLPEEN